MSARPARIAASEVDFRVMDEGAIVILWPVSDAGTAWADEHLPADAPMWGAGGFVIEHRYVEDIVNGATEDGLVFGRFPQPKGSI